MINLDLTEKQLAVVKVIENEIRKRPLKSPDVARLQALLWWTIQSGTLEQMREVLAAGADPNFIYPNRETPLAVVLHWRNEKNGGVDFFRALCQAGANVAGHVGNKTVLAYARRCGNGYWAIEPILDAAPPGKLAEGDLKSALLVAVCNAPVMQRLLQLGASPDYLGDPDNVFLSGPISALMYSAWAVQPDVVGILLAAGANVNLKDNEGHTALDYAMAVPQAARKVAPILIKAGGVSGKPFKRPGELTRGFATASKTPAFLEAVARIEQLTAAKSGSLVTEEGRIPGGKGCLLAPKSRPKSASPDAAKRLAAADKARELVEHHQDALLAHGFFLFYSRDIMSKNGEALALLPTADVYRVIEILETNGTDSTEKLIERLRELEKVQPFAIFGIGSDFIDGKFTSPIKDAEAIARRIQGICPDASSPPAEVTAAADRLRATNRLYLWWD